MDTAHAGGAAPVGVTDGRAAYLIGKAAKSSMETGKVSECPCWFVGTCSVTHAGMQGEGVCCK